MHRDEFQYHLVTRAVKLFAMALFYAVVILSITDLARYHCVRKKRRSQTILIKRFAIIPPILIRANSSFLMLLSKNSYQYQSDPPERLSTTRR
mmetsp:Transcript_15532/g.28244  ORF Transcript_15532/g.28244 Transcript_15532/m.28244 type:complete len:93 (+) Transcript_15532:93-371(+)